MKHRSRCVPARSLLWFGALAVAGCGPSQVVLDEQDRRARQAYEERSVPPKNRKLADIHEKRLKLEFGGGPDSPASPKSSPVK